MIFFTIHEGHDLVVDPILLPRLKGKRIYMLVSVTVIRQGHRGGDFTKNSTRLVKKRAESP